MLLMKKLEYLKTFKTQIKLFKEKINKIKYSKVIKIQLEKIKMKINLF
jgi:hypothetical protein